MKNQQQLANIELNYKDTSVSVRESAQKQISTLRNFLSENNTSHFILSTCNRLSIYVWNANTKLIANFLKRTGIDINFLTIREGNREVSNHLMRTACGLDSMIVGENEIVHQIKSQYNQSIKENTLNIQLNELIKSALAVSKQVRKATNINKLNLSVASVGLKLALDKTDNPKTLLIGTGKLAALVSKLISGKVSELTVASHSIVRATEFASQNNCKHIDITNSFISINDYDLIIGCTNTEDPINIINQHECPRNEVDIITSKSRVFLDLGSPRNFPEYIPYLDKQALISLDQIHQETKDNLSLRKKEVPAAEKIIDSHLNKFELTIKRRENNEINKKYWQNLNNIKEESLEWLLPKLENLSEQEIAILERFTHQIIRKISKPTFQKINELNEEGNFQQANQLLQFINNKK